MATVARTSGPKTRETRTGATVRVSTNLVISSAIVDNTAALRAQRLNLLGIIGARADLLASLIWADGGNERVGGVA